MELPTLDGLLKEVGITLASLNERCSDEHLTKISLFLEWKKVAPHLGLDETDIEEIETDKKTDSEKRLKTLQKWKSKYGYMARYFNLVKILLEIGSAEHAEKVCRLLRPEVHTAPKRGSSSSVSPAPKRAKVAEPKPKLKPAPSSSSKKKPPTQQSSKSGSSGKMAPKRGSSSSVSPAPKRAKVAEPKPKLKPAPSSSSKKKPPTQQSSKSGSSGKMGKTQPAKNAPAGKPATAKTKTKSAPPSKAKPAKK